ncbi:hypothetical protein TNIN_218381 [Trichonephila inaurata madagascariensis]|uniref:Uncharacterized protein n=1 Tax=Trichonephila inaurata madagascariensis TaxID=2747483 RepID=A0A8X6XK04_9ARAC|nr:hypothetical protein TNIN_218381 [Trichonephila inaurata madagascariensis]
MAFIHNHILGDGLFCSMYIVRHSRGQRILALVPKLHVPSDVSDQSDSECELQDNFTHYSSPAPSLGSIADLNISYYGPDSEDEQNARVSHDITDEPDINLNSSVNYVPLNPILQEIDAGNYQNVPSTLSALASFPVIPVTPTIRITPDIVSRKKNTRKSRKTISKKTNLPPAKRAKKMKRFQLTYKWKRASLSLIPSQSSNRRKSDRPRKLH